MAIEKGTDFVLKLSTAVTGGTMTLVARLRANTFDRSTNMVETSSKDSNDDSEFIAGMRSWSTTATGIFEDNASQDIVEEMWEAGEARPCQIIAGSAGTYEGMCLIENISLAGDNGAEMTYNISIRGTGALTKA